jgi:hypothetical protein
MAWPSGPANQVRNAWASVGFGDGLTTTPAYAASTFAVGGMSTVVTLVDALASVT